MDYITLSDEERKQVQRIELSALVELDRICRKNNINYSLCGGTLLGAVRHKGFIPWDDDVDVFMLREEYDRFEKACETELSPAFFYQSHKTDPEYYHLFNKIRVNGTVFKESFLADCNIHHGIFIDIFPIDYVPDNKIVRFAQYLAFHFYRTGLMAKFLNIQARQGKKKRLMQMFRLLYAPFLLEHLYSSAVNVSVKYNNARRNTANSFCGAAKQKEIFNSQVFENLITANFESLVSFIPQRYDEMLTRLYGDYMTPPPPEKRGTRHDLVQLDFGGRNVH